MQQGELPTPELLSEFARLHGLGMTRAMIAEHLNISLPSATKYAKELGLDFTSAGLKAAHASRAARTQAKRDQLADDLLDDAERMRKQLFEPYVDSAFVGGAKPQHIEAKLTEPKAQDKAHLMRAIGTAVDKSVRLLETGSDTAMNDAKSVLQGLGEAIKAVAEDTAERLDG